MHYLSYVSFQLVLVFLARILDTSMSAAMLEELPELATYGFLLHLPFLRKDKDKNVHKLHNTSKDPPKAASSYGTTEADFAKRKSYYDDPGFATDEFDDDFSGDDWELEELVCVVYI